MADDNMKVIVKAKELMAHTFTLTTNEKRYPKKFRHSLVDRMQLRSMDIYEILLEANRTDNKARCRERCELITKAIMRCDNLLSYIELSMNIKLLSENSAKYWSKLVCDVKYMALAWRKKEQSSY
ncbi:MAG: four helix bundle protein [Clostridia bacterium]|nr:four helix bundle protein [Clostridia bacterium]